jgi:hypothetical protein
MKVSIKAKTEPQERVTLRFPASLKRLMDDTHALAERKGADYYASIVDAIASANQEIREKLLQMPDTVGDKSGDRSGDRISTTQMSAEPPVRNANSTSSK